MFEKAPSFLRVAGLTLDTEWPRLTWNSVLAAELTDSCPQCVGEAMNPYQSPLERAFELARSGEYESVDKISAKLHQEGYRNYELIGPLLHRQLRKAIREAEEKKST